MRNRILVCGCVLWLALSSVWAQNLQDRAGQLQPTAEQLGSIYYAYPAPQAVAYTPAPAEFQAFYISHYGRHGSRWMTDDSRYSVVVLLFDSLQHCGGLTPLGEDVRRRLHIVWQDARGRSGNITPLGERQQRDIARRMMAHYPELLRDSAVIDARSSTSLRCAMSMSYFTEALKEVNPRLRVSRRAYGKYMDYIAYTSPQGEAFSAEDAPWRRQFAEFEARLVRPGRLLKSLFTRPEIFDARRADDLMRGLYWIAADIQNTELQGRLSFYDLFTRDELTGLWRTVNARMYVCNGNAPLARGVMRACARPLLDNIVQSADRAIAARAASSSQTSQVPAVDLRFGHDTHLLRLLALMQVEGCNEAEADMEKFHEVWQDYRLTPMGANLQLIFYRNSQSKVLVRLLLNEREAKLPIEATAGCYYDWEQVKRLWE